MVKFNCWRITCKVCIDPEIAPMRLPDVLQFARNRGHVPLFAAACAAFPCAASYDCRFAGAIIKRSD